MHQPAAGDLLVLPRMAHHGPGRSAERSRVLARHLLAAPGPPAARANCTRSEAGPRHFAPEAAGVCPERLERVDAFVERIVSQGEAPMAALAVLRHGRLVHLTMTGHRDEARGLPVAEDTVYRMFSMTKPVVSVALLMLYEEGRFVSFDEPVGKYLPCFRSMSVYVSGDSPETLVTRPAKAAISIKHLLTHMSGLCYGFQPDVPAVSEMYQKGVNFGPVLDGRAEHFQPYGLEEAVERLSKLPLVCDPGTEFHYSHSTDVVGRLVEVLSGRPLAEFLKERVFEPLGMAETGFWVPPERAGRFAALYATTPQGYTLMDDPTSSLYLQPPTKGLVSGGGGLVSTLPDWVRWAGFLLRKGATEGGRRLLGPKTFEYAALNHLPGGADLEALATKSMLPLNTAYRKGQGFSLLGMAVLTDPARYDAVASAGELAWGSVASGYLWVDHAEGLAVILKTQIMPSGAHTWRRHLHGLIYQALTETSEGTRPPNSR